MSTPFGTTTDGDLAQLFTLGDDDRMVVRISDFGATLVEVHLPDREGVVEDVVLGFDSVEGYQSPANPYFGATVGRVANRIANAEFTIDDEHFVLAANEPPNALHGGPDRALSKVLWTVEHAATDELQLAYSSPDGEEGYPGRLDVSARYRVRGASLELRYRAVASAATPVNLTNHTYWNLAGAGAGSILDHEMQVFSERFTPTDDQLIPTGAMDPVAGTPLDLRSLRRIGDRIDELAETPAAGYDHNFVLDDRAGELRRAARLRDPGSGRVVELHTDQPGLQVYSGNRLSGVVGKGGKAYGRFGGVCLEPQHHPDALHRPEFGSIILRPGEAYDHTTLLRFGTDCISGPSHGVRVRGS